MFKKENIEKKLIENDRCIIKLDAEGKVRIENLSEDDIKLILPINKLVMDLNNIPISYKNREKYANDIKNIYTMALCNRYDEAIEYTNKLKEIMERNLELVRAIQYTIPATIIFLLIIAFSWWKLRQYNMDMYIIFIFSSLGGILSLLVKQKKFNIDYKVQAEIIIIESIKRVIITIVMGTIGYIALRADIVFSDFKIYENKYVFYLIIVICGYSTTFIPNLLDNMTKEEEKLNA